MEVPFRLKNHVKKIRLCVCFVSLVLIPSFTNLNKNRTRIPFCIKPSPGHTEPSFFVPLNCQKIFLICIKPFSNPPQMAKHFISGMGIPFIFLVISMMFSGANSDAAKDREECTNQLVGLAGCLPYIGGNAKAPTPDCCSGLKQVLKTNKKCLCVVVRDRNDPQLGLTINVTLALGLPSVCNAPANLSECPALLHMDPNSPEAQVFYQSDQNAGTPARSPVPSAIPNATTGGSVGEKSDGHFSGTRWLGLEAVFVAGLIMWLFTSHSFI